VLQRWLPIRLDALAVDCFQKRPAGANHIVWQAGAQKPTWLVPGDANGRISKASEYQVKQAIYSGLVLGG